MLRTTALLILSAAPLAAQTTLAEYPGKSSAFQAVVVGGHDLNFDGVPDVVMGAPMDDTAGANAGAVYVRSGATGALLWWRYGSSPGDNFGESLAMSPDLNGDGVWEVVVGAPPAGLASEGLVYVLSGLTSAPILTLSGKFANDWMGVSVAADFDLDTDGVPDIGGGAPYGNGNSNGYVRVWSGADGSELRISTGINAGMTFYGLNTLGGVDLNGDGFNDIIGSGWGAVQALYPNVTWTVPISGTTGLSLGNAGDIDGDGADELLVGSANYDGTHTNGGIVWSLDPISGLNLIAEGNAPNLFLGNPLAGLGDIDGDGRMDWAVGASNGAAGDGHVRVISGKFKQELYRLTGSPATSTPNDVAALGDVNGDGFLDVAVADATYGAANDGLVAVFSAYGPGFVNYCTPGTSTSGCTPTISAGGTPSAFLPIPFALSAYGVEGNTPGLFFYGWNGRQANPWGNGSSYQCVAPPVKRAGLLPKQGTSGQCDGQFSQDLNAHWNGNPGKNPGPGTVCQAQLWYRDPFNTSNQTTSMTDALEFYVDF